MSYSISERCQWGNPLLSASHFAITEIGVVCLKCTGFHAPDDPLSVEDDLAFLSSILTVEALTGFLVGINWNPSLEGE